MTSDGRRRIVGVRKSLRRVAESRAKESDRRRENRVKTFAIYDVSSG